LSDSTKRLDFVVKILIEIWKAFEQLPFETIDEMWARFIRKVKWYKFIENLI
jgi:hypothetical protein